MDNQTQLGISVIHTTAGNAYEVTNSIKEIADFMFDSFIDENTFIPLKFPDGLGLYLRKRDIESFYESE